MGKLCVFIGVMVLLCGCRGRNDDRQQAADWGERVGQLRVEKRSVEFGWVYAGEVVRDTLRILNEDTVDYEALFNYDVRLFRVKMFPERLKPGKEGMIVVEMDTRECQGYEDIAECVRCINKKNIVNTWMLLATASIAEDFRGMSLQEREEAPVVTLDTFRYDFGTVEQGTKVHWQVRIGNNGKKDLIIRNIKTTCGCTAAVASRQVIAAGKEEVLNIELRTNGRLGRQHKTITVTTNDWRTPRVELQLEGNVEKARSEKTEEI